MKNVSADSGRSVVEENGGNNFLVGLRCKSIEWRYLLTKGPGPEQSWMDSPALKRAHHNMMKIYEAGKQVKTKVASGDFIDSKDY